MDFMTLAEQQQKNETENGAIGYKTTGHKLVDLNFAIPSFRNGIDGDLFRQALYQDERLTLKWLLYLRDVRNGIGERSSFRSFIKYLVKVNHQLAKRFLQVVPIEEYGRWDDYVVLLDIDDKEIFDIVGAKLRAQLLFDVQQMKCNKPISLLAKWLPSENASSVITKRRASVIRKLLKLSPKNYRKCLSKLRKYLDITEVKMSANEWGAIEYSKVPSRANLKYRNAFLCHDEERRNQYIESLTKGETKVNAQALFLHDIVHSYDIDWLTFRNLAAVDETLEQMWKSQDKVAGFEDTVVVRDGSGSMRQRIGNTGITAQDIANAITLYCAENNTGGFKDKFITFSRNAKVVDISDLDTLKDRLVRMAKETECTNTNIQNVFDLILDTAIDNNLSQENLPKNVLIISDMEFDGAIDGYNSISKTFFKGIANRFKEYGYSLPKLIFWNINSRTNTIPIMQNENGVILLSGFSKNLMNLVMSSELDPYKALIKELEVPRYDIIDSLYA